MRRKWTTIMVMSLFASTGFTQQVQWVKQIENHEGEFYHKSNAADVCSDANGNVISTGTFKGTFDFDTGTERSEMT